MTERQFTSMAQKRRFEAHQREMERIRNENRKEKTNLESEAASSDDAGSTDQTEPNAPTTKP